MLYTLDIHCIGALSVRCFVCPSVSQSVGLSIGPFIGPSPDGCIVSVSHTKKLELIQIMAVYYVRSWSETCVLIRFPIINHLPFLNFYNHYTANASSIVLFNGLAKSPISIVGFKL